MSEYILVVDDDATNRELIEAFLTMQKYTVKLANDGTSALEIATQAPPMLVITDVKMYDMSGYELCKHLKASPTLGHIPVMIVTGYDRPEDMAEAQAVGADDFISRPLNYRNFIERVAKLVNRG